MISFYTLSRAPSAGAVINAGSYRMEAFPGSYRVEISAAIVVGRKKNDIPDGTMIAILESIMPAVYNSASKLVPEVKLDTKTLDFKLVTPAGK